MLIKSVKRRQWTKYTNALIGHVFRNFLIFLGNRFQKSNNIYIYIYIYIYILYIYRERERERAFNKFPHFLYRHLKLSYTLKIQYVIAIRLMRWLTNFYDFSFEWTATAAIGIHPTKTGLSQLVNFKNAIWTWGRTICNKIVF